MGTIGLRRAGQAPAGGIPPGAGTFEREAMTLAGLPVESTEPKRLSRSSRRRSEKAAEGLKHAGIRRQALGNRIGAAKSKPCAQYLHFVVSRLREETVGMLDGGHAGII